jgi:hypothetical protein
LVAFCAETKGAHEILWVHQLKSCVVSATSVKMKFEIMER